MPEILIERLAGDALRAHLPELARLRIEVFHDFPYLYEGSEGYEQSYLETYAKTPGSVIVGAFEGEELVGAATALPLSAEPDSLTEPFRRQGIDPGTVFYFGESVLRRAFRGRGIGVAFFEHREAEARRQGFRKAAFCAVIRPENHPRRPPAYVPLDAFWRKRGFAPVPGLVAEMSWRDLDEAGQSPKPMQFWMKDLGA